MKMRNVTSLEEGMWYMWMTTAWKYNISCIRKDFLYFSKVPGLLQCWRWSCSSWMLLNFTGQLPSSVLWLDSTTVLYFKGEHEDANVWNFVLKDQSHYINIKMWYFMHKIIYSSFYYATYCMLVWVLFTVAQCEDEAEPCSWLLWIIF